MANKTYKCKICPYETDNYHGFAGHMGGHSKRGEKKAFAPPQNDGDVDYFASVETLLRCALELVEENKRLKATIARWQKIAGRIQEGLDQRLRL